MRFFVFLFLGVLSNQLFAISFSDLNLGAIESEILKEKKVLSGRWKSGDKWKGYLCQGEYSYNAGVQSKLEDLKLQVAGESQAELRAELVDISGDAFGSYKSSKSLCIPFSLGVRFIVDRITVVARGQMIEEGNTSRIEIHVLSTKFGKVHFGSSLPPSVENFITKIVNTAFRWVWDSRIGTWLSKRISDEINKQIE